MDLKERIRDHLRELSPVRDARSIWLLEAALYELESYERAAQQAERLFKVQRLDIII